MKDKARIYVADSGIHGRGLYAAQTLRRDSYIGTLKGPPAREDGTHVLWLYDEDGNYHGRVGRNDLRYVNHDKDPNAEFESFDLYALRDIAKDEEITIDYGW